MRTRMLIAALSTAACATPRPAPPPSAPFEIVDTLPVFWDFWSRAEGRPAAEAFEHFQATLLATHPAIYAPNVLRLDDSEGALRSRFDGWFAAIPEHIPTLRRLHTRFVAELDDGTQRFMQALPKFAWSGRCYLMVSLDSFDGAGRDVGGEAALLFGLDVIARLHPEASGRTLMVLVHHELFHFHQRMPSRRDLLGAMWVEGLATYASRVLNPGTPLDDALPVTHLHDPADPQLINDARRLSFERDMPAHLPELQPMFLAHLDSESPEDYATFFLGRASPQLGERPVRSGYYFGLRVAEKLGRERSLQALAELDAHLIREEIRQALAQSSSASP